VGPAALQDRAKVVAVTRDHEFDDGSAIGGIAAMVWPVANGAVDTCRVAVTDAVGRHGCGRLSV
jgi:hypothetical protein